ncbi:MAG: phosphatase PAP2 family protein [Acholeplasma sp.]|nr:phosphatase PAP2 family protein [Acholeplasma sp.]
MKKWLKTINWYPLIPAILLLGVQLLSYYAAKGLNSGLDPNNFNDYYRIKWSIDDKIPLVKFMSIIYFGSYIWWGISPFLMGKYLTKDRFYRFFLTTLIVHCISFLFYVFYPTYMFERPGLNEVAGTDILSWLTRFIIVSDVPNNLLPSMHSTVSWLAVVPFLFVKDSKVPKKIIVIQIIMALLVFISTVTTRQHYLVDVIVAVILVEVVFFIVKKANWHKGIERWFTQLNTKMGIEK